MQIGEKMTQKDKILEELVETLAGCRGTEEVVGFQEYIQKQKNLHGLM